MKPTPPRNVPRSRTVEIVCHRGANAYAPANTMAAARLCADWGMDYIEVDVNRSKDGVLYIFHGPELEYTTNGVGLFHDLTAAEIDQLDAGSWFDPHFAGERVPRLHEFLDWVKGKAKVFFDVKRADLPQLLALVETSGLQDKCFFWFGDDAQAQHFRRLAPHLALKVNARDAAEIHAACDRLDADIIEVDFERLNAEVVAACRARGVKIMVYHTENDPDAFRQMLAWGVDLINCDHGDVVARVAAGYGAAERRVQAVLLDCGDTLVDEGSEVKPDGHTSLRADLIPGAAE